MPAISPSIFEQITIQSADDADRTVDIRGGVLSIDYYESILSASYSMKMTVVDTAESITDIKTGKPTTIYQGLPLRGGERVSLLVSKNTGNNYDLDFLRQPLVVRGISNASLSDQKQIFSLDLVPESAIINEVNFVEKIWNSYPVSNIVEDILKSYLKLNSTQFHVDPTSNAIGFGGNLMKPFTAINKLANTAVSADNKSQNVSAGFLFYQTRFGTAFRAIDNLLSQSPKATYVYNEVNVNEADFEPTPRLPSLDRKIISYSIIKNQDVLGNLKTGAYATTRRFFDPITHNVTIRASGGDYSSIDYGNKPQLPTLGLESLGADLQLKSQASPDLIKQYFNEPSRYIVGSLSKGTWTGSEVNMELDFNPFQIESQKAVRYNTLFTQAIQLLVPLNSKLCAGDVIELDIPMQSVGEGLTDNELSGSYLIKDICHNYTADGSFTSMKVVRDTYGRKVNN